ncbi:MAG: 2-oxoacid:acceptor oxidoreductase family protein [Elusimicrobiales bacterium]|nr:2-oxoacid:acceptor oxidoreductase family protein [Elusimicrobiales bacterium]HOL63032.1 2-oxoacid:acceptor oxidoreductase family protein [Elusimicrobiales bacterium]HPO95690.1 2-oxoacid:acceptor oxidoreductase family protein [Elusimicrobiales bacterium]
MYLGARLSGFGGQGVISAGVLLAYAGMIDNKNVSFFPAYGAEMRGGTANCSVVISDDEVASPVVTAPDVAVVFNEPSFEKFEPMVKKGGILIINSSLVNSKSKRTDIKIIEIPLNQIADKIGNSKVINMIALGALSKATGAVSKKSLTEALPKVYKKLKPELINLNVKAVEEGYNSVN